MSIQSLCSFSDLVFLRFLIVKMWTMIIVCRWLWSQATATLTYWHQLSLCYHCVCLCVRVFECMAVHIGICLFVSWRVSLVPNGCNFSTLTCGVSWDGMGPPSSQLASLNILTHFNTFCLTISIVPSFGFSIVSNSIYIYVLNIAKGTTDPRVEFILPK